MDFFGVLLGGGGKDVAGCLGMDGSKCLESRTEHRRDV